MAVSSADFYTYARETGTPVANTPEEKAALYPAVYQWKRSRLNISNNENQEDLTIFVGEPKFGAVEGAAVLGGLVGAGLGVRALKNRYRVKPADIRVDQNINRKRPPSSPQAGETRPKPKPNPPGSPTSSQKREYVEKRRSNTSNLRKVTSPEEEAQRLAEFRAKHGLDKPQTTPGIKVVSISDTGQSPELTSFRTKYGITEDPTAATKNEAVWTKPIPELPPARRTPLDFLTENNYVDPETAFVIDRAAQNPHPWLESLADEQLDVIRGTTAKNPLVKSEIARQNARKRAVLAAQADEVREQLRKEADTLVEAQNVTAPALSNQSVEALDIAQEELKVNQAINTDIDSVRKGKEQVAQELDAQYFAREAVLKQQIETRRSELAATGLKGQSLEVQLQNDPIVQASVEELMQGPKVKVQGMTASSPGPQELEGLQTVTNLRDPNYDITQEVVIDENLQGGALRGGKIVDNELRYTDAAGNFISEDITKRPTESTAPIKFTDYSYIDNQGNKRVITAQEKGRNYQALRQGDPEALKNAKRSVLVSETFRQARDPRRIEQRTGRPARPQYMLEEQRRQTINQDPTIPLAGAMDTLRYDLDRAGIYTEPEVVPRTKDVIDPISVLRTSASSPGLTEITQPKTRDLGFIAAEDVELPNRPRTETEIQAQRLADDAIARTKPTYQFIENVETTPLATVKSWTERPADSPVRTTTTYPLTASETQQSYAGQRPNVEPSDLTGYPNTYVQGQSQGTALSPFIGEMGQINQIDNLAAEVGPAYRFAAQTPSFKSQSIAYVPRTKGSTQGMIRQSPLPTQSADNPPREIQTPTAGRTLVKYPRSTERVVGPALLKYRLGGRGTNLEGKPIRIVPDGRREISLPPGVYRF